MSPFSRSVSAVLWAGLTAPFGAYVSLLERRRGLAIGLSLIAAAGSMVGLALHFLLIPDIGQRLGVDYRQYLDAANQWMSTGTFYHRWQFTPYVIPVEEYRIDRLPVLYPPTALLLFLPFTASPLLAPLWWAIPVGIVVGFVRWCRPRPWTWPLITCCAAAGTTTWLIISGNPVIWTAAAVCGGLVFGWPAVAVLVKPTLAPFALIGINRRSWWIAGGALVLLSLPFGALWIDFAQATINIEGSGFLYSAGNVPLMALPLVAWIGRSRSQGGG